MEKQVEETPAKVFPERLMGMCIWLRQKERLVVEDNQEKSKDLKRHDARENVCSHSSNALSQLNQSGRGQWNGVSTEN